MTYSVWLIRPFPHNIDRFTLFKEHSIIAIGWPLIGNLTNQKPNDFKNALSNTYNLSGLSLGNAFATVDMFVNKMTTGDLILMPYNESIYFGKIKSDYSYKGTLDNEQDGCPHQRKVEWVSNCLRTDLSMDLRTSLKVHRAVANLSHHYDEISILAKGEKSEFSKKAEITLSYPLRPNFSVDFKLPNDITKEEAQRLSLYFSTLYFNK